MGKRGTPATWLVAAVAGIISTGLTAQAARAADIVDQQPTADIGLPSTFYTLTPAASMAEIDSFTTAIPYHLGTLTAFTSSDGIGPTLSVTGSIYSGGPPGGPGASLVTTAFGSLNGAHSIVVDFGGALLPAGTYYLTAFVEREAPFDGIWYWNTTFSGPQAYTWPIGMGLPPAPETSMFTTQPLALAYTLTGSPVVSAVAEPPSGMIIASGLGLMGLFGVRRKRLTAA